MTELKSNQPDVPASIYELTSIAEKMLSASESEMCGEIEPQIDDMVSFFSEYDPAESPLKALPLSNSDEDLFSCHVALARNDAKWWFIMRKVAANLIASERELSPSLRELVVEMLRDEIKRPPFGSKVAFRNFTLGLTVRRILEEAYRLHPELKLSETRTEHTKSLTSPISACDIVSLATKNLDGIEPCNYKTVQQAWVGFKKDWVDWMPSLVQQKKNKIIFSP